MTTSIYEARPGVDWVNGKRVPKNREMELTEAEARFDLAHGRIALKGSKPPRTAKATANADQSDRKG